MEEQPSHVPPFEPIVEMRSPRVYGSFPTLFGMPLAETEEDLRGADVAFLGVPWRAPTTYPVLKAIAERADGPTAVLNLDAHGDNQPGGWEEDEPGRLDGPQPGPSAS